MKIALGIQISYCFESLIKIFIKVLHKSKARYDFLYEIQENLSGIMGSNGILAFSLFVLDLLVLTLTEFLSPQTRPLTMCVLSVFTAATLIFDEWEFYILIIPGILGELIFLVKWKGSAFSFIWEMIKMVVK